MDRVTKMVVLKWNDRARYDKKMMVIMQHTAVKKISTFASKQEQHKSVAQYIWEKNR